MDAEIARLLKEALERVSGSPAGERENLTRDFAKRLRDKSPETAAMIWQARSDGTLLCKLSEFALKSALGRPDLSVGEKLTAFADAGDFRDAFEAVYKHSLRGVCPLPLAFDLAFDALFVGLNAGAPPERIEEARALGRGDVGRCGGQKSAVTRKQHAKEWQAFAAAELKRLQAKPNINFSSAAKIISKGLAAKFPSKPPVKSETVRAFLRTFKS
jgi:hypothetical protein